MIGSVVVNYNAGSALVASIESIAMAGVSDIVVVDNGSTDDSLDRLGSGRIGVRVLRTSCNLGYGGAVNAGAATLKSEFLLVCNPDIVLEPDALKILSGHLNANPSLGVVGPTLLTPEGGIRRTGGAFPSVRRSTAQALLGVIRPNSQLSRRHRDANAKLVDSGRPDWLTGACLLVRRQAFDDIGGFDPQYFMYVEEIDFCWRIARAGWGVGFAPEARVVHIGGVSTAGRPLAMSVAHHLSLWRYTRRTTTGAWRVTLPLVAAGISARLLVVLVRNVFGLVRRSERPRTIGDEKAADLSR